MKKLNFTTTSYVSIDVDLVTFRDIDGEIVDKEVINSLSVEELHNKVTDFEYFFDADQLAADNTLDTEVDDIHVEEDE